MIDDGMIGVVIVDDGDRAPLGRVVQTVEGLLRAVYQFGTDPILYEVCFMGDDGERIVEHRVLVHREAFDLLAPYADSGERIRLTIDCLEASVEPATALTEE